MTNNEIHKIALSQSAIDCHCEPKDFLKKQSCGDSFKGFL